MLKQKFLLCVLALCILTRLLAVASGTVSAATDGVYTYNVSNGKVTITDCDTSVSGELCIPDTLGGYPVTTIGAKAFESCTNLTTVTIPEGVTALNEYAFHKCSNLTAISIPFSIKSIGASAFRSCRSLTDVYYSSSVTDWNKITIGSANSFLTSASHHYLCLVGQCGNNLFWRLTDGVLTISGTGDMYLYDSYLLQSPWCEKRKEIKKVVIENGANTIDNFAFYDCPALTEITIPNSVTKIGDFAFAHCGSLAEIAIPNSVTKIGVSAFAQCDSLTEITIPGNPTILGDRVFEYCDNLTKVTFADGVTQIGYRAFQNCPSLAEIHIPDSVTEIGWSAFEGCNSLTEVLIPHSVTEIGGGAFCDCINLKNIIVDENNQNYTSVDGNLFTKDKTKLVQYAVGKPDTTYHIPSTVCDMEDTAFRNCKNLTAIKGFFYVNEDCHYESIDGNLYKYQIVETDDGQEAEIILVQYAIGNPRTVFYDPGVANVIGSAFYNCDNLTEIVLSDEVKTIYSGAFSDCDNLKKFTIPDSVTDAGSIFSGCDNLSEVIIGSGITNTEYLFDNCTGIKSVTIPKTVTTIGSWSFVNCPNLESIIIKHGATKMEQWAIQCPNLKTIVIPNSITTIESLAFDYCNSLTDIHYTGTQEEWNRISKTAGSIPENVTIHFGNYMLCYDANGGFDIPKDVFSFGEIKLPDTIPTNLGFTFLGWATTADAVAAEYQPGDTVNLTANLDLYAIWKETSYLKTRYLLFPNLHYTQLDITTTGIPAGSEILVTYHQNDKQQLTTATKLEGQDWYSFKLPEDYSHLKIMVLDSFQNLSPVIRAISR